MSRIALFLPTLEGGGAERAFVELANDFVARGVEVDFVLGSAQGPYRHELSGGVHVVDFATSDWVRMLFRLTGYLRERSPEALLSGLDPANVLAVLASAATGRLARCVISQRAVILPVWRHEHPRTWRFWTTLIRATYPRAAHVICNSTWAAREVIERFGVMATRCSVILNGIDTEHVRRLSTAPLQDSWVAPGGLPLVVSVGRLMTVKDMTTVVRAFALVRQKRECRLVILGEGVERAALEALVRSLGIEGSVRLPGFVANPFPWMSRADVLVSASLAEGCPNVLQQALACRTPIVATDCPGATAEVLEHGRWGRLVPLRDPERMAAAITATLDAGRAIDGRQRARDFDRGTTAERYLDVLVPQWRRTPRTLDDEIARPIAQQ